MKIVVAAGAALTLASMCAGQSFDAKVGLWESTSTMEMEGLPTRQMPNIPPEKLAQMPKEQRERIEAMMKGSPGGGARTMTVKSCLTKESLASAFSGRSQSSCTQKVVTQTSALMQVHFECTPERGEQMSGDLTVERVSRDHVKTSMLMKGTGAHPMTMKMHGDSHWLADDCGDVKPAEPK